MTLDHTIDAWVASDVDREYMEKSVAGSWSRIFRNTDKKPGLKTALQFWKNINVNIFMKFLFIYFRFFMNMNWTLRGYLTYMSYQNLKKWKYKKDFEYFFVQNVVFWALGSVSLKLFGNAGSGSVFDEYGFATPLETTAAYHQLYRKNDKKSSF